MVKKLFFLSTVCLFVLSLNTWAQDTATILGTITDSSGAVVPGAKVVVSNPDKGFKRELVSDSAGAYIAPGVPIGTYSVSAEAKGFERTAAEGVTLTVGQTQRVDLMMRVGSATQTITVSTGVAKVETDTGTISDVVNGSQVSQLNLNGRSFTNLATLVPGAAALNYDPTSVGVLASSAISFNGAPTQYNSWEIDGTNNTDQGAGGTANMVYPNIDSIAEFRITTSTYNAESSKNAGGNVEVATKAGTSQFHGDAFEFVRNDKLDANDWFANRQIAPPGGNAPKTPLKRNDYGFTLGGPIYIPDHYNTGKSKTFFFWSEEWRQFRQGNVVSASVPTARMRQGDFSECDPSSGNYNSVVASNCVVPANPTTGLSYPGDMVPIDPRAGDLLNALVPTPNNGIDGYVNAESLPTYFREDQIRVDQNLGSKTSVYVRYTQDAYDQTYTPTLWSSASYDTIDTKWTSPAKSAVFHLTTTFRPDLTNEFIMGFSADVNTVNQVPGASSPAHSIDKPSGWSMPTLMPANAKNLVLPGISVCGGGGPACFTEQSGFNYFYWGPVTTWKDNLVWARGKHMLKFGIYIQDTHLNQTTGEGGASTTYGNFSFANSGPYTTGNALADMYLGEVASYSEYGRLVNGQFLGGNGLGHWREWDFEPYFQDDWRATSRLTLNLGARYYLPTAYHDILTPSMDSVFLPNQFNPAAEAQIDINGNLIPGSGQNYLTYGNGLEPCGTAGIPRGCMSLYRGSVVPRVGFAWDPTGHGKTAIRGGYGISYDVANGNEGAVSFFGNPPTVASPAVYYVNGYNNLASSSSPIPPTYMNDVGFHQTMPSVQQFSLGVQHEFAGNNLLTVSYVGSLGRHLQRGRNMDQVLLGQTTQNVPALAGTSGCDASGNCNVQQILINDLEPTIYFVPFRGYSSINDREWAATSSYSSLQVEYRHKVGHGLTLQTAYTWSHTIDNMDEGGVNDYDLERWKATSGLNQAQILVFDYVYQIPLFAHSSNAFARTTLGGWELSGITSFQTGEPIDFGCGIAGMSSGVGGSVRCNSLGPVKIQKGETDDPQFGPTPTWFNPNMIGQINLDQLPADNEPGMFGYTGRNFLTGPGRNNWDIALLKNFALPWFSGERSTIQFRWETFNTFNHPQWATVNASCGGETPPGTPCSGVENNLGNSEVASAFRPRIMQFGMKFIF